MAIQEPLTEPIIGTARRVAISLGHGFLEKVHENALAHELRKAAFAALVRILPRQHQPQAVGP